MTDPILPSAGDIPADVRHSFFERGELVRGTVTVQRPGRDLYAAWRDMPNLPLFMSHIDAVEPIDDRSSRWTTRGPLGTYTWIAEIINDVPGELLAWVTRPPSDIPSAGSVRFRELSHGRGTEVHVSVEYVAPGGRLGRAAIRAAHLDPKNLVHETLHRFRQLMETGEIARAKPDAAGLGGPAGRLPPLVLIPIRDPAAEPTP